ncbi:probable G-protein coupled receptor Mth-like 10 [Anoplolepis gracilipes]|uniref:probable G-protein coupled receptor Mth-like 10 n=1 Tax=Anoplolepis gracilipes TaxID=354296 RepID=UPI003BA3AD05
MLEFLANFTKIENDANNTNDNKNHIVSYEMCDNITCIQLCCPLGDRLVDNTCISGADEYDFPEVYKLNFDDLESENKTVDEIFQLIVRDPCQGTEHLSFYSNYFLEEEEYVYLTNGSLYFFDFELDIFVEPTSYCLAVANDSQFEAIVCLETMNKINETLNDFINDINETVKRIANKFQIIVCCCRIVSMLCLLIMFLIYSILPELRNIHGFMLCRYSSMLFYLKIIKATNQMNIICVTGALVRYFSLLSSSFWFSVMSFDMWWTFRDFRSLRERRNVKQEKRKKLMYSIFAWGGPFILTIICVIMDFTSNVSKNLIRPGFVDACCLVKVWHLAKCYLKTRRRYFSYTYPAIAFMREFILKVKYIFLYNTCTVWCNMSSSFFLSGHTAYLLYYYAPYSICVISSICLSICTALKITRYEKDTARHLRNSESRCYNDNKKWFKVYLKLFIVLFILMALNWILSTYFWQSNNTFMQQMYILYTTFFITTIKNLGIFIMFVCKKTIIRLLLKRVCQNRRSASKTSESSNWYRFEQLRRHQR